MSVSQRKRLLICSLAALLCALGAASALYFALTRGYDPVIRHFAVNSPGLRTQCVFPALWAVGSIRMVYFNQQIPKHLAITKHTYK